jgi:hypothetical protein
LKVLVLRALKDFAGPKDLKGLLEQQDRRV